MSGLGGSVQHPAHHEGGGSEIRREHVGIRADHRQDPEHVGAGEASQLSRREPLGVTGDAAFGAAERQSRQCGLPRHQPGQRGHPAGRHRRVVADAALGGAQRVGVLDPVTGVDLQRAVVAFEGNFDLDQTGGAVQGARHRPVESQPGGCPLKPCGFPIEQAPGRCGSRGLAMMVQRVHAALAVGFGDGVSVCVCHGFAVVCWSRHGMRLKARDRRGLWPRRGRRPARRGWWGLR